MKDKNEKLAFTYLPKGDWIINFRYKDRLLTLDYIRELMRKQLLSLSDDGLDLFKEVLDDLILERTKPRPLSIDDPWGNSAA